MWVIMAINLTKYSNKNQFGSKKQLKRFITAQPSMTKPANRNIILFKVKYKKAHHKLQRLDVGHCSESNFK